ncbi:uncharacterized protein PITG_16161 [Phytophthora infestans T30-4]|uniref:Uncharacterized protein n=1 Tax=Phytophthora infestans (strain T30-4) TaxID=403677 RepID=D0NT99_PHYIT|nr:uncharacterized protein PITG_16161 [Phytophthora infestans T30-4]EEY64850.1 hypothetical protein PITG_16161 [Phytophthora infestans T30-4]|eukprot:XP_002897580.1 hypothetical protein PITG_16161 [Phytophthora infestans T30-4]
MSRSDEGARHANRINTSTFYQLHVLVLRILVRRDPGPHAKPLSVSRTGTAEPGLLLPDSTLLEAHAKPSLSFCTRSRDINYSCQTPRLPRRTVRLVLTLTAYRRGGRTWRSSRPEPTSTYSPAGCPSFADTSFRAGAPYILRRVRDTCPALDRQSITYERKPTDEKLSCYPYVVTSTPFFPEATIGGTSSCAVVNTRIRVLAIVATSITTKIDKVSCPG